MKKKVLKCPQCGRRITITYNDTDYLRVDKDFICPKCHEQRTKSLSKSNKT